MMDQVEQELFSAILNERASYEMAYSRKDALAKVKRFSNTLLNHIIKCLIYGKQFGEATFKDWKEVEICGYLSAISSVVVKGSGKLKREDYFRSLTESHGTTPLDYWVDLMDFRADNLKTLKYPDFIPSKDQGRLLMQIYLSIIDKACDKFICPIKSPADEVDANYFVPIVTRIFKQFNIE